MLLEQTGRHKPVSAQTLRFQLKTWFSFKLKQTEWLQIDAKFG